MYFVIPYFCNKSPISIEIIANDYDQINEFFDTILNIKLKEIKENNDPTTTSLSETEIKELLDEDGWCAIKTFSVKFDNKMKQYFRGCEEYHDKIVTFCIVKSKIIETKEIIHEIEKDLVV